MALELRMPAASYTNHVVNQCINIDYNELVKQINVDLVYIDPPYNSRQYCDAYHLLEKEMTAPMQKFQMTIFTGF